MRLVLVAGLTALCASPAAGQKPARELGTFPVVINTVTTGVVLVTWQPVQKAAAYEVERCEGAGLTTCTMKTVPRITAGQPLQLRDNLSASGTYLYRVTAYGSRQLPIAQGQVAYVYTAPPTVVLMPAPSGTITPIPAGPAQLNATSPVPGQIQLSWSLVPPAIRYKVVRGVVGAAGELELPPPSGTPYGNTPYRYIDAPVQFQYTYTYKVYAYVMSGANEILTAPSPVATVKSLPFVQVSGLTYTIVPSVKSPGNLDLTMRWNAVPGAEKYIVTDRDYGYVQGEVPGALFTWVIGTRTSYTMCVGVQYPYNIRQGQTEPCVTIKT
jgi:hypothetical protein